MMRINKSHLRSTAKLGYQHSQVDEYRALRGVQGAQTYD